MPVNVLNLPGLRVLDFKETDTDYHVRAEPTIVSKLCPHCGRSNETVAHAQKTLFIRDLPSHGKSVAVHLDVPRLRCKPCGKTFTAAVPEVDTARQMTERLAKWVGRQGLEYTYAEIAKQVGIDEKTVRNVFDEYVAELEKEFIQTGNAGLAGHRRNQARALPGSLHQHPGPVADRHAA